MKHFDSMTLSELNSVEYVKLSSTEFGKYETAMRIANKKELKRRNKVAHSLTLRPIDWSEGSDRATIDLENQVDEIVGNLVEQGWTEECVNTFFNHHFDGSI